MGKECYEVYENLPLTVDERKDSDSIISKLTEYYYRIYMNDIYSIWLLSVLKTRLMNL